MGTLNTQGLGNICYFRLDCITYYVSKITVDLNCNNIELQNTTIIQAVIYVPRNSEKCLRNEGRDPIFVIIYLFIYLLLHFRLCIIHLFRN